MQTNPQRGLGPRMRRIITACVVGNVLEWYDFALFGLFAPVLARQFFPEQNRLASLLATLGIFAAGFLMRPLGAIFFGSLGDRHGRKKALLLSIILMALPTFCIGCLPTYASVGILAPVLLTICRLLQGLSIGGEYTGSLSYLVEHAPNNRRAYVGSWTYVGSKVGVLLGSIIGGIVTASLSQDQLYSWGWRLPFLFGVVLVAVGLPLRNRLSETPAFEDLRSRNEVTKRPLSEALRSSGPEIATMVGLILPQTIWFYLTFVYVPTFLNMNLLVSLPVSLMLNTIPLVIVIVMLPLAGRISDSVGRKPILFCGTLGMVLLAYPGLKLVSSGEPAWIVGTQVVFAAFFAMASGPTAGVLVEVFPTRVRLTGMSLAYNLSTGIFGGMTPLIATYMVANTGNPASPAMWVIVGGVVGLLMLLRIPETHRLEALT